MPDVTAMTNIQPWSTLLFRFEGYMMWITRFTLYVNASVTTTTLCIDFSASSEPWPAFIWPTNAYPLPKSFARHRLTSRTILCMKRII